jgi:hypothetical protein
MTFKLQCNLSCMHDLVELEKCLRVIYKTAEGNACQALMTLEYVCWRNKVIKQWKEHKEQEDVTLSAFLSGYKLVFCNNICCIAQLQLSSVAPVHVADVVDVADVPLKFANKKRKICPEQSNTTRTCI